jgi:hypothetical protein
MKKTLLHKVVGQALNLALGDDIMLPQVVEMGNNLVGRATRHHLGLKTLMDG